MTTEASGVKRAELGAEVRRAITGAFEGRESFERERAGVRLSIDGSRAFLLVYRAREDSAALGQLVRGEASYLMAGADADPDVVRELVRVVAEVGSNEHNAFLVVEIWAGADEFRVYGPEGPAPATVAALVDGLREMDMGRLHPEVTVVGGERRSPPNQPGLLTVSECHEMGCLLIGLEIPSVFRDADTGAVYPVFLRRLAHGFSRVVRRAAFEFLRVQTGAELPSYRALGRRHLGDTVWSADRRLSEIGGSFDILLLVAPVNADRAWERFRDGGYERPPELSYRLLPVDPDLLKRELYAVELETVEDPAAWRLLRDKREELDRQISLLAERNTPDFIHGSIRLFGHIDASLLDRARDILDEVPPPEPDGRRDRVGAEGFAARAEAEFDYYRSIYDGFESEVQVRPDIVGLMVSSGKLLVGSRLSLRPERVEALLQHEVGTHVLTFVNGAAQPFLQLARGFADYDELQEGLGVLAEFLVGGLDAARMRLLAARVVAVHALLDGASFIDTFRRLHRECGFRARMSFNITTRVYQSGGFTRDIIYLRGLVNVVEYLRDGGELEPMYVGKIAARHLDVIRELRERGVLRPMPLLPRFLDRPAASEGLESLRAGLPIHAMVAHNIG